MDINVESPEGKITNLTSSQLTYMYGNSFCPASIGLLQWCHLAGMQTSITITPCPVFNSQTGCVDILKASSSSGYAHLPTHLATCLTGDVFHIPSLSNHGLLWSWV